MELFCASLNYIELITIKKWVLSSVRESLLWNFCLTLLFVAPLYCRWRRHERSKLFSIFPFSRFYVWWIYVSLFKRFPNDKKNYKICCDLWLLLDLFATLFLLFVLSSFSAPLAVIRKFHLFFSQRKESRTKEKFLAPKHLPFGGSSRDFRFELEYDSRQSRAGNMSENFKITDEVTS